MFAFSCKATVEGLRFCIEARFLLDIYTNFIVGAVKSSPGENIVK